MKYYDKVVDDGFLCVCVCVCVCVSVQRFGSCIALTFMCQSSVKIPS
jgi:hypothetical protein